jgi:hypothetical protein
MLPLDGRISRLSVFFSAASAYELEGRAAYVSAQLWVARGNGGIFAPAAGAEVHTRPAAGTLEVSECLKGAVALEPPLEASAGDRLLFVVSMAAVGAGVKEWTGFMGGGFSVQ